MKSRPAPYLARWMSLLEMKWSNKSKQEIKLWPLVALVWSPMLVLTSGPARMPSLGV